MITDYEPYLRVSEDGRIWWPLRDAIRLGAGFLPVRDDQALKTELQAPNQRALVNERTLIGAFGSDRYSIERPITFERDGFRYVEAEGFLTWLSQYISQTQAEIAFPNELASKVRMALAQAAASRPSVAEQEFESLTHALDGWFDKKLDDLPQALRQLVERDFFPNLWDALSAEQRRHGALQRDYQLDPDKEQDRQYWWNFFTRRRELQKQKEQWESAATPTARDLAVKESRLKELQQEIDRMELQLRQGRGDYYPERKPFMADKEAIPATDFIAYPKAMNILHEKWRATPDELAMWILWGPEKGGIAAYLNANELNPPREFYFAYFSGMEDYLAPLMSCWFHRDDIDRFEPADRYITGAELIERWGKHPGIRPEAFIRAKIAESRLLDCHPTFGHTIVSCPDDNNNFPPLSAGLFSVSQIELIESEDDLGSSPTLPRADTVCRHSAPRGKGGRPKEPLAEAVERAYLHFRDKGDLTILQPGNIRSFLKSFKSLANDEPQSLSFGNGNISAYIAERIKEVKIPREGECSVKTQDRAEGRKINPGQGYSQKSIAKLLAKLRKKYPLPS